MRKNDDPLVKASESIVGSCFMIILFFLGLHMLNRHSIVQVFHTIRLSASVNLGDLLKASIGLRYIYPFSMGENIQHSFHYCTSSPTTISLRVHLRTQHICTCHGLRHHSVCSITTQLDVSLLLSH